MSGDTGRAGTISSGSNMPDAFHAQDARIPAHVPSAGSVRQDRGATPSEATRLAGRRERAAQGPGSVSAEQSTSLGGAMGGPRDLGPLAPAGPGCPAGEVLELALAVSQPRGTESCSRTRAHARAHAPGQRVGDGLMESPQERTLSLRRTLPFRLSARRPGLCCEIPLTRNKELCKRGRPSSSTFKEHFSLREILGGTSM